MFNHVDFKQVAAQHTFTMQRTDKAYAQSPEYYAEMRQDMEY